MGFTQEQADEMQRRTENARKFSKLTGYKNNQPVYENHHQTQSPVAKRPIWRDTLAAGEGKEKNPGRVLVRVTSYRVRRIDPDNLCPKYFIDCCRYAGLLRDDSAAEIELAVAQVKVPKGQERTEIELI